MPVFHYVSYCYAYFDQMHVNLIWYLYPFMLKKICLSLSLSLSPVISETADIVSLCCCQGNQNIGSCHLSDKQLILITYSEQTHTSQNNQGPYSPSGWTSYHKIPWSLEAAMFGFRLFKSLRNLIGPSVTALSWCLSNFRAIRPSITSNLSASRLHENLQ